MKFRAKRQAVRTMTAEQEARMVVRQRDALLRWLVEREGWCPLVEITDVRHFFPIDPFETDLDPTCYDETDYDRKG